MSKRDEDRMPPIAGKRAAEHRDAGRQALVAVAPAGDQVARRADLAQKAFLVGDLLAAFLDEAAQDQLVPVRLDLLEAPGRAADHLGADLLGLGNAVGLELAVGMVGADGDPQPVGRADQYRLGLAGRVVAHGLDGLGLRQQARGDAIVQRHLRRRLHADRLQLLDVMLECRDIAAGPAGDYQVIDGVAAAGELDLSHQRTASCEFKRSVTSM